MVVRCRNRTISGINHFIDLLQRTDRLVAILRKRHLKQKLWRNGRIAKKKTCVQALYASCTENYTLRGCSQAHVKSSACRPFLDQSHKVPRRWSQHLPKWQVKKHLGNAWNKTGILAPFDCPTPWNADANPSTTVSPGDFLSCIFIKHLEQLQQTDTSRAEFRIQHAAARITRGSWTLCIYIYNYSRRWQKRQTSWHWKLWE